MSMYKLHIIDQGLNVNVTSKKEEKKTTLIYTHVLYLVVKIQIMLIHRVYKITFNQRHTWIFSIFIFSTKESFVLRIPSISWK